jgi:hypothetical protein
MTTAIPLGVDPGNGAIKIYGPHGGVQLPASVAADTQNGLGGSHVIRAAGLTLSKPPLHVRTAGGAFYLGLGAHDWGRPVENMDHERFTGTPEMCALVYGALSQYLELVAAKAEAESLDLNLTIGLPIEALTGAEEAVKATATAVRRWIEGAHAWEADGKTYAVTVQSVTVTLQPAGALYDYLLDETGVFIPGRKAHFGAEIGVISIGMNTLEVLLTRAGKIVPGETHGARLGVRRLLELCNPGELYTLGELDGQLRTGKLDVSIALPIWASEVMGLLERRWGAKHRRFAAVILVGGGVRLLRQQLALRFSGKAYIPDDPVLATACGLHKFTRLSLGKRRTELAGRQAGPGAA